MLVFASAFATPDPGPRSDTSVISVFLVILVFLVSLVIFVIFLLMMITHELSIRPQGDEYSYDDYSEDNYYDTPDNYDYGDTYADHY